MPIRAEPNAARAIRAFFTEAAEDNAKTDEADKLRAELVQAQEEAARASWRSVPRRQRDRRAEKQAGRAARNQDGTARRTEARTQNRRRDHRGPLGRGGRPDRHHQGATTAAPVVWLAGDTKPHEKEIEAAGGKWSGKKNAYYFRVA